MNVLHSIPPPHAVTTGHAGWLYTPATDLCAWAWYALVAVALIWLLPGQLGESIKALWGPVGAWIAALPGLLAMGWWGWMVLGVLESPRVLENVLPDFLWKTIGREQLRRLGFPGFIPPETT